MGISFAAPSVIRLPEDSTKVRTFLEYVDNDVKYQLQKTRMNYQWKRRDPDGHAAKIEELKLRQKRTLMMLDQSGTPYTYAGLWRDFKLTFGWDLDQSLNIPQASFSLPWAHVPDFKARYYQEESVDALFDNAKYGPAAVELPTGSGKSRIIEEICKRNPVPTTVITPSKTITNQLHKEMVHLFGGRYVGKYGAGRHDLGKLFTVCTGQALTNIEPNTEEWDFFVKTQQFVWDESHTTPADTMERVALGLLRDVPARFFVSATQMRNDGTDMLLKGITGPVVYRKEFKKLVDQGFLARPYFHMFEVPAFGPTGSRDGKTEVRNQLHLNPHVNKLAAEFAQKSVTISNRQTIILLEEFNQFLALKPYLTIPYEFAHGGIPDREVVDGVNLKDNFPREQWKPDVDAMVDRFNRGETKLLIGTSAISTGVDTKPTGSLVYLQGGTSETKVKQGIGRGTRITDAKKDLFVADFRVVGSKMMERHANERVVIYNSMGDVVEHRI
jgi:superfamily II DNA or RNA helicase